MSRSFRRTALTAAVALAFVLGAASCGDDDDDGGTTVPSNPTVTTGSTSSIPDQTSGSVTSTTLASTPSSNPPGIDQPDKDTGEDTDGGVVEQDGSTSN